MSEEARFMWIRTPQQALDMIANLIHNQVAIETQDVWLKAVIELGFVNIEGEEE